MRRNTILWADDDAEDLQLMQEILAKTDYDFDIVEVKNGKEALDYLKKAHAENKPPCLIILDINMPVLDGKETLSYIKKNQAYASIPVVVFTTSDSELDKLFCQRYHTELVTKPPSYASLAFTVRRLLSLCH